MLAAISWRNKLINTVLINT